MNRKELVKELDALQDRYKIQEKYGRSVLPDSYCPNGPAALRAAEERLAARLPPSRAEKALEEIASGQAAWKKFQEQADADEQSKELRGPNGVAQRKDGLDMSFHQLLNDASRMRTQLNEIGLQLNQGGRDRAVQHLQQSRAVPRNIQEEFREQQKVLVEQKRMLEQLRHEREVAAGDQFWLHRKNRLDHDDNVAGKPGVDPAVPPEELFAAHRQLRADPEAERVYGWSDPHVAVPPQDGYVYAEILRVSRRQQPGTVVELCIIDKAGVTLARNSADFPDEVGERCALGVTIPAIAAGSATAEVWILGPTLQNSVAVPLSQLPATRGSHKEYIMEGEKPLTVHMDLSSVKPQDERGNRLQATRVVESTAGVCPTSDLPSAYPQLPPSDAHRRSQKKAWDSQGRPDFIHGADVAYNLAAELDRRTQAVASRKKAPLRAPPRALPRDTEVTPRERFESPRQPEEEQPVRGGFFSGWEEPEPHEQDDEATDDLASRSSQPSRRSEPRSVDPARGFGERGPREYEDRDASLTPRHAPRHGGKPARGLDELDFATEDHAVSSSSAWERASQRDEAATPHFESEIDGYRYVESHNLTRPKSNQRSHSQPVPKKKKKVPRPYFESEEATVRQPPRGSSEHAENWVWPDFPFAAFGGFGSSVVDVDAPEYQEPEVDEGDAVGEVAQPEAEPSSFLASFAMPFAAFAGFGDEPKAAKKPPPPPKPKPKPKTTEAKAKAELKKMTKVGWQPWATIAAEDASEPADLRSVVLPLRPPHSARNLDQLYAKLLLRQKDGKLGMPNIGQDVLELAARVAKLETLAPNLHQHEQAEVGGAHARMTAYAALLLDSLQKYENSSVLGLWIVEALTTLFRAGDTYQQAEFCVPFFRAFAGVALRFQDANSPNLHMRVLQGLAEVASPDCRICEPGLIDYVIEQLDQHRNKLNTLTVEHALSILCVLKSPHRVNEQIRHCLLVLRGLKSEQYLCTRAMVTAAELYGVVERLIAKERAARESASSYYASYTMDDDAQDQFVADLGIPPAGVDVRLVATVMDLYPNNRKLAGAALRTFSAMAKMTRKHLQDVLAGEVRPISNTLHEHAKSRSVNLHVAELMHLAATKRPELISDSLMMMACKSLRSSTRDAEIVTHLLLSLEVFLAASAANQKGGIGPVNMSLAQALPSDVLVRIGDIHHADSGVIAPLCHCIDMQATASPDYRDDFVNAGAMAVPLRVFDEAETHSAAACAASAHVLKELLIESRKATSQFMDAGGPRLIFNVLSKQCESAAVVQAGLAALAVAAQFVPVRRAMIHPQLPHTLTTLDQLFRVADAHLEALPDVLPWACLAAGALTECEHEESQEILRKAINLDQLQAMLSKVRSAHYNFSGDLDFCQTLIDTAAKSRLSNKAILAKDGQLLKMPAARVDAPDAPKSFHAETVTVVPETEKVQGDWHAPLDIFAPLRKLGVGADQFGAAITHEQIAVLQGVASAPVKADTASKFLRAVRDEFMDGKKGSVEGFMARRGPPQEGEDGVLYEGDYILTVDEQRALRPFIQRMLDAPDKSKELQEIQHRWNVKAAEDQPEEQGFFSGIFGGPTPEEAEAKATAPKAKAKAPTPPPPAAPSAPSASARAQAVDSD